MANGADSGCAGRETGAEGKDVQPPSIANKTSSFWEILKIHIAFEII
jgi:hypothetical protein